MNNGQKNIRRYAAIGALRVILFFVFLEFFLWANGQWTLFVQQRDNLATIKEGKALRIMCVGDSMTAYGDKDAYPRQLDRILNASGKMKFEVFNKGVAASGSDDILANMNTWLAELKPDVVVVMMGAEDLPHLTSVGPVRAFFNSGPGRLGSVRMLSRVVEGLIGMPEKENPGPAKDPQPEIMGKVPEPYMKLMVLAAKLKKSGELDKAAILWEKLSHTKVNNISFNDRIHHDLAEYYAQKNDIRRLAGELRYFLLDNPFDAESLGHIQRVCSRPESTQEIMEPLLKEIVAKYPDNAISNEFLGSCYAQWGRLDLAKIYFQRSEEIRNQKENIFLKQNYLKLVQLLKDASLKGVFLQYPTYDVEPLRAMLAPALNENFRVVDNEVDFAEARDPQKYAKYFEDRSHSNFGHCTAFGNSILAKNAAKNILDLLNL